MPAQLLCTADNVIYNHPGRILLSHLSLSLCYWRGLEAQEKMQEDTVNVEERDESDRTANKSGAGCGLGRLNRFESKRECVRVQPPNATRLFPYEGQ